MDSLGRYYHNTETAIQAMIDLMFIQNKMGETDAFLPVSSTLTDAATNIKYVITTSIAFV